MRGRPRTFKGIGASPGVAIGRVFLLDRRKVRVRRYHIEPDQADYEIERLKGAIARSVEQLESIRSRFVGEGQDHQAILEGHEMMLRDQSLLSEAGELIRNEFINAEWAISRVISRIRSLFVRVANPYFRERLGDFDFVGERILRNLAGQPVDISAMPNLAEGTVVVARDLSPVDTALLARHRVTAFVTEVGGKTSHTSIIARSLEVPAVVGAHGILDEVGSGDLVVVDGSDGIVVLRPSKAQQERGQKRAANFQRINLELLEARALPATTLDGCNVIVAGNIEMPNEIANVFGRGGESIGLYRTEFIFLGRHDLPGEEDHYRAYCQLFNEAEDRAVTIRTLDLGGEKLFGPITNEGEPNPALGLRAIRYCLQNVEIFKAQIAALLRAATRGDMRVMLPMISGLEELRTAKELIAEVADRLVREGKEHRSDIPIGIMLEVPSSILIADALAQECDFFAVGTNDLLQYLLAIDRTNERVAYLYDPLHPAVLRTLHMAVRAARNAHIPISVCGEIAGDAEHTPVLVGFGFEQLSMNAGSIPNVKRVIRELHKRDCEQLVAEALECSTSKQVAELLAAFTKQKMSVAERFED